MEGLGLFLVLILGLGAYAYYEMNKDTMYSSVLSKSASLHHKVCAVLYMLDNDPVLASITIESNTIHRMMESVSFKDKNILQEIDSQLTRLGSEFDNRIGQLGIKEVVESNAVAFGKALAKKHFKSLDSEISQGYVRGSYDVILQFDLSPDDFRSQYQSYKFSLTIGSLESNWNDEIDDFAHTLNCLNSNEIESAKKNLHQAILNRIIVRNAVRIG